MPQYPMTKAIAGPHTTASSKCCMIGGMNSSAAIQPTKTARTRSSQRIDRLTTQLVIPPAPPAMMQQALAPIASINASMIPPRLPPFGHHSNRSAHGGTLRIGRARAHRLAWSSGRTSRR